MSLEFLKKYGIAIGDSVSIQADVVHTGRIMPKYEYSNDNSIVIKLASGYNVGLKVDKIKSIEKTRQQERQDQMPIKQRYVEGLPKVLLLSTGGTIASKVDYRTGAVTPVLSAEELSASVPELADIANIETEQILSEYSENIVPEHWMLIAQKIAKYAESKYAGIIIAHGTDTMHYTSSFLSFALAGFPIPIVLTGAQRSSDRASSDAALNLIGAARFIVEERTKGVYIAMHKDGNDDVVACHIGTRVRKNHTSKRGAFETIGAEPAFTVSKDISRNLTKEFFKTDKFEPRIKIDTRVVLIKYHPGFDPNILDSIVKMGYRGVIFEGTGLGHIGRTMYESLRRANEKGVFLGMTSQCIDGRVRMTVYESGRDLLNLGIIPMEDMIPEVALVKAMWAFGNWNNPDEIREVMLKDIAMEISH